MENWRSARRWWNNPVAEDRRQWNRTRSNFMRQMGDERSRAIRDMMDQRRDYYDYDYDRYRPGPWRSFGSPRLNTYRW
jgi:hypothetical protein